MSQHEAFLRPIIETPEDDAPRLVYADWLEDHGDPDRAEFIRVQCRLASIDEDDPERRELLRREYDLLAEHGGEWAAPLVGKVRRWQFRRGFVEQVCLEAKAFLKEAKWLFAFAPVRELDAYGSGPRQVRELFASEHLRRIRRLELDHVKFGDAGAALLAASPNVANLTHLSLQFTQIGRVGLRAIATSPSLSSLRSLDVSANRDLQAADFAAFVSACELPCLERMEWGRWMKVGLDGLRALLASPLAAQLTALEVR